MEAAKRTVADKTRNARKRPTRMVTAGDYRAESNWLAAATVVCILLAGHAIYRLTESTDGSFNAANENALRFTINVNEATAAQLQALPDIGPTLARRIVEDREQNGPFRSIEGLTRVHGFGPQTLANLEPMLTLGSPRLESAIQLAETGNRYP
ncbi:MAG: ComEA family DNA-binding protein [Aureliella sp.]